jgi:hypothetical protein
MPRYRYRGFTRDDENHVTVRSDCHRLTHAIVVRAQERWWVVESFTSAPEAITAHERMLHYDVRTDRSAMIIRLICLNPHAAERTVPWWGIALVLFGLLAGVALILDHTAVRLPLWGMFIGVAGWIAGGWAVAAHHPPHTRTHRGGPPAPAPPPPPPPGDTDTGPTSSWLRWLGQCGALLVGGMVGWAIWMALRDLGMPLAGRAGIETMWGLFCLLILAINWQAPPPMPRWMSGTWRGLVGLILAVGAGALWVIVQLWRNWDWGWAIVFVFIAIVLYVAYQAVS